MFGPLLGLGLGHGPARNGAQNSGGALVENQPNRQGADLCLQSVRFAAIHSEVGGGHKSAKLSYKATRFTWPGLADGRPASFAFSVSPSSGRVSVDITGELRATTLVYGVHVVGIPLVRAFLPGPDVAIAGHAPDPRDEYKQHGERQSGDNKNGGGEASPTKPSEGSEQCEGGCGTVPCHAL